MDLDILNQLVFPKGDEKSFRIFFEKYHSLVYKRFFFLVGDRIRAEELTQDIFINLWERRKELEAIDNWRAYLLQAATFKAIDERRKRKSIIQYREDISLETSTETVEETAQNDRLEELEKQIDQLPERCQLVFRLHRFEQLSYKQIAQELGISVNTVENQIGKAIKILRKNLLHITGIIFTNFFLHQ